MKHQNKLNRLFRSSLVVTVAALTLAPVYAQEAKPAEDEMMPDEMMPGEMMPGEMMPGKMMMHDDMMERCRELMKQQEKMMAEIKAQDDELAERVAEMNRAPEDEKLDALADIVTRLVDQRTAMHEQMGKMHEKMMNHMMHHMQMGKESMTDSPMMMDMMKKDNTTSKHPQKSDRK